MHIEWHISQLDQQRVKKLLAAQQGRGLMGYRQKWNLAEAKPAVTKERLWRALVCMRLTTQSRSGPTGNFARFQQTKPFPLGYDAMRRDKLDEVEVHKTFIKYGVGRHPVLISQQLIENFQRLEGDGWHGMLDQCNRLQTLQSRSIEAEVADFMEVALIGFGPKQSRNVLQALGLTRYEIPIDSRIANWLNMELGFPFRVTSSALSDKFVYSLTLDGICKLCDTCKVFPCILDAAIFGALDREGWQEEAQRY